jgi:hypothetical protein
VLAGTSSHPTSYPRAYLFSVLYACALRAVLLLHALYLLYECTCLVHTMAVHTDQPHPCSQLSQCTTPLHPNYTTCITCARAQCLALVAVEAPTTTPPPSSTPPLYNILFRDITAETGGRGRSRK